MVKLALLIGVSQYLQEFPELPSSQRDVSALQNALQFSEISDFDDVKSLINPNRQEMQEAIDALFSGRERNDLAFLYFSGHGIKDESGKLYLATPITRKNSQGELVKSTAVAASFIHDIIDNSRSTRQVIILDCCFSGAFAEGLLAKRGDEPNSLNHDLTSSVDIESQLGGEGRAILTSSTSVQYSFEQKGIELSIYTRYLVEGIETGAADLDSNGWISIDELHQYAKKKVQGAAPAMSPEMYAVREGFRIQLIRARTNDPLLIYRKEVEQCALYGDISKIGRRILDRQKEKFKIPDAQAKQIEDEVLQPFKEYRRKLGEYEDAFNDAVQIGNTLSNYSREELNRLKQILGLRDEDVVSIESKNKASGQIHQYSHVISPLRAIRTLMERSLNPSTNYDFISNSYLLFQSLFLLGFLAGLLGIMFSSLIGYGFFTVLAWVIFLFIFGALYLYFNANKLILLFLNGFLFFLVGSASKLHQAVAFLNSSSVFVTIFLVCTMSGIAFFLFASLCALSYRILTSLSRS